VDRTLAVVFAQAGRRWNLLTQCQRSILLERVQACEEKTKTKQKKDKYPQRLTTVQWKKNSKDGLCLSVGRKQSTAKSTRYAQSTRPADFKLSSTANYDNLRRRNRNFDSGDGVAAFFVSSATEQLHSSAAFFFSSRESRRKFTQRKVPQSSSSAQFAVSSGHAHVLVIFRLAPHCPLHRPLQSTSSSPNQLFQCTLKKPASSRGWLFVM
jgi:hypothetical protein